MSAATARVAAGRAVPLASAARAQRLDARPDRVPRRSSSSSPSSSSRATGSPAIQGLAISVLPLALAAVAPGDRRHLGRDRPLDRRDDGADERRRGLADEGPAARSSASRSSSACSSSASSSGAINGGLVVVTRVPDIVVTLAMSFVWAGCALLVLKTPGGGSAKWLKDLVIGSLGNEWIPKAAVVLIVIVARDLDPAPPIAARPVDLRRSAATGWRRSGAACRSAGRRSSPTSSPACSPRSAACRSPRAPGSARRCPGPYTLMSVAAVVLGGVSLAGGRGGVFGALVAVMILQLIRTDMTFLNVNTEPRGRRAGRSS